MKCGWCITKDCDKCRPVIEYEGKEWKCECEHKPAPPMTEREWLGYGKYDTYVEGTPN